MVKANFVLLVEPSAYELYLAYVKGDRTESAKEAHQTISLAVQKMHLAGLFCDLDMPQVVEVRSADTTVGASPWVKAIESEREYQKRLWGENPHSITEFLSYIRDYTEEALHAMCRLADAVAEPKALDTVRKVGALAVACMDQHGAPQRDLGDLPRAKAEHQVV